MNLDEFSEILDDVTEEDKEESFDEDAEAGGDGGNK